MKKISFLILSTVLFFTPLFWKGAGGEAMAQKEANIWYFGNQGGLDFNSGTPVALTDGLMNTSEGCASIADANGKLLFYTNGDSIWNKQHQLMNNGTGLSGHQSSTQSAIIVPKPKSGTVYYVFTVDYQARSRGFKYSEIDMSLAGGLGAVTANKNIPLLSSTAEKLTAVQHANGMDIWVVVKDWDSNAFYAYLVSGNGVSTAPVISNTGTNVNIDDWDNFRDYFTKWNTIGAMKVSANGKYLALAHTYVGLAELFDFDNATGNVSNPLMLNPFNFIAFGPPYVPDDTLHPYGVEFSPSSQLLYVSDVLGHVFQYNLNATNIASSGIPIGINTEVGITTANGSLQLGPDKKIYLALGGKNTLDVIKTPDVLGMGCNYTPNEINLEGGISLFGLPDFVQSFFSVSNFSYSINCNDNSVEFAYSGSTYDSLLWNFGDPASGAGNTSTTPNPVHTYPDTGSYTVKVIVYNQNTSDNTVKIITIFRPTVNLGNDTAVCKSGLLLNANTPNVSHLWHDGSTDPTFNVTTTGNYYVTVTTVNGCKASDSITVIVLPQPIISAGADKTILIGFSTTLQGSGGTDYFWTPATGLSCTNCQNPDASPTETITYSLTATDANGCTNTNTVTVFVDSTCAEIFIPSAFSPNNDGSNELECVFGNNCTQTFRFAIYDRWGNEVFETDKPEICWDGTYKGKALDPAVFVYYLQAVLSNGKTLNNKGNISLIR